MSRHASSSTGARSNATGRSPSCSRRTISLEDVRRVRDALESGRRSYRMKLFAGMPHGWLNDTMPGRYRAKEAKEAWVLLTRFLADVFSGAWPGEDRVRWEFESATSVDYDFSKNTRLE